MRIQHNIMAMNAYRNYTANTSAVAKNLEKLSSGYKINRAGDDAAGLAISEKMRAQITGLKTAQKNVKDGISLVKTAEGATQEIHDMLNRMVDLATQSANGTYQDEVDREAITNEFEQLKSEINRIADSSNFNGIKLLDGSLGTKGVASADSIKVAGNANAEYSTGAAGVYDTDAFAIANSTNFKTAGALGEGDTFEYGVHLADGTGYTVKLTAKWDADNEVYYLEGDSGAKYNLATNGKDDVVVTLAEMDSAIKSELQKTSLADQYVVASDGAGAFTFTAKEQGTATPAILAVDAAGTDASSATDNRTPEAKIGVTVTTQARDAGYEIDREKLTEYDGTNYEDAVFTINGKKFVLMTENHKGDALGADPNDASMNATYGLSSDVTILVGGTDGLKEGNDNFDQNINKIKEATGLNVTAPVANDANDIGATSGIRLTVGKGNLTGGLTLQIGDTSDSFNQLTVSIKDMHAKALGIADLNLGTQSGAQAAVKTIKDAINYVSDVRGTLGATQNRLEHTQNNLSVMQENIQDAESSIRDTDIAEEMMAYTKNNILVQSAQAMLAQANQVPQGVLQLLG